MAMKIRDAELDHQHHFAQNALTWTFPINIVDPITELKVHFRTYCHTTKGGDANWFFPPPMPYVIEEIAIIDGSEVIYALNGACAVAMSTFDLEYMPFAHHQEFPGATTHWCFPIHFGRSLVDPEWILDPRKFRNLQMRITWDLAAIHPVGAGGFINDEDHPLQISIWAKIMEEGATPRGYLMTKEVKEYTPTGPGDEVTYLPTDFPHRKLMVRSYGLCGRMGESVEKLKLSQDQDKWIPFDIHGDDFIRLMKNWFEEVATHGAHYMAHAECREHTGGWLGQGVICPGTMDNFVTLFNWSTNCFCAYITDTADAHPDHDNRIEVYSYGKTRTPFDCFCYPFGDQSDPADWLEVGAMGNLRLILTHADGGGTPTYGLTQIVTQQAHPY